MVPGEPGYGLSSWCCLKSPHMMGARVERREYRRCKPVASAFVVAKIRRITLICWILDISPAGLAFSCSASGERLSELCELDILLPHPFCYLQHLPFELVSDCEIDMRSAVGFATERHGVRFEALTRHQGSYLSCLIETLLALPWGFSFAA
jgi:hypothetical protein